MPRKTKIDTDVAHVTRDSDITFNVKRSKVKVTRPLWLAVQVTTYDTIIITRASRCLSIMNIHGARRAGRRRRKACMGWSWTAACGVQGRGAYRAASRTACYRDENALYAYPTSYDQTVHDRNCGNSRLRFGEHAFAVAARLSSVAR